ncbi:MAG TPA: 23S rRNA (uracil(1939)-C(5))-methyltransferase RlmD [Bacteroidales bacterium]|nr:23S rRNA (uracil(1939)-C(5))-methyltransferase RlmD [Bacteroidales bacterium]HPO64363.1 23S rRNA (uracil(1939)-C(5))-methyltransferase RlmD [Bacteroidales bacterium]
MGRKKKQPIILSDVAITEIAAEGKALTRVDDQVVFVPMAIPGDIVDILVTKKRSHYLLGRVVSLKKPSPLRVEPLCEHFGVCGGCKWQHLPYSEQLKWKQKQVVDTLERIGGITLEKINPILGSEQTFYYRNKLEYTFSNNRWLPDEIIKQGIFIVEPGAGFHIEGMFDRVLDIRTCHLQPEPTNQLRLALKKFLLDEGIPFYNLHRKQGLLRNLVVRNSLDGKVMAVLVFGEADEILMKKTLNYVADNFPDLHSIMYGINTKLNDSIHDLDFKCWKGEPYLYESIGDLRYRIGPKSFFQTNSRQAFHLYETVKRMAQIAPHEVVYDLYTGTGTIALYVARQAKRVIGIEYVEDAIADAVENARLNLISNVEFYAGDVKDIMTHEFIASKGYPDVLIADPPRVGMHDSVIETILQAAPQRIVYVSCNPATQARDIKALASHYRVAEIQPVDMFPHTHHVENVACLVRK